MATTPPLPPPPPPPPPPPLKSHGNQPRRISPPPCPGYAAIPFLGDCPPVQETSPSAEAIPDGEGAPPAPPLLPVQNGPLSPPSEGPEDNQSDSEEKCHPVPETSPEPQMTEQQDEAATQTDQTGEEQES